MRGFKSVVAILLSLAFLGGCSVVQLDARRAHELAVKYEDPEAAKCWAYLADSLEAGIALKDEDTAGLLSLAEKARILRRHLDKNEAAFKAECGAFVLDIMVEIAKR